MCLRGVCVGCVCMCVCGGGVCVCVWVWVCVRLFVRVCFSWVYFVLINSPRCSLSPDNSSISELCGRFDRLYRTDRITCVLCRPVCHTQTNVIQIIK